MKRRFLFLVIIISAYLFILKFIEIFKVIFYLLKEGRLKEAYILRGNVTLLKIDKTTVYRLPTEYDFFVLGFILIILVVFIICYIKARKKMMYI